MNGVVDKTSLKVPCEMKSLITDDGVESWSALAVTVASLPAKTG